MDGNQRLKMQTGDGRRMTSEGFPPRVYTCSNWWLAP